MKVIAEIGLNHCGSSIIAKKIVKKLVNTDTDGITFQIKKKIFYSNLKKAHFLKDESFFNSFRESGFYKKIFLRQKFKSLNLSKNFYKNIINFCKKNNKQIGFAVGDITMLKFLSSCGADFFKILSEDLNNKKLIKEAIKSHAKIIFLSTGFHSVEKIENLLKGVNKNKIVLIHTKFEHSIKKNNLKKISLLKKKIGLPVGFGNHSKNFKIFDVVKKYKPNAIFFYVKSDYFKFHPDDLHAIHLKDIKGLCKKLKKL